MYISEVVKTLKLSKKAIELYEQKGLLKPERDKSGYRIYGEEELIILRKIKMLRQIDFSISQIQAIINEHNDQIFHMKKEALEKEAFIVATKIQYIDYVEAIINGESELIEMNEELQATFDVFDNDKIKEDINRLNRVNFKWINTILIILAFVCIVFGALDLAIGTKEALVKIAFVLLIITIIIYITKVQLLIVNVLIKLKLLKVK